MPSDVIIDTFSVGDWDATALQHLEQVLNQKVAYRDTLVWFVCLPNTSVQLVSDKRMPQDLQWTLCKYIEGFFEGWSLASEQRGIAEAGEDV